MIYAKRAFKLKLTYHLKIKIKFLKWLSINTSVRVKRILYISNIKMSNPQFPKNKPQHKEN